VLSDLFFNKKLRPEGRFNSQVAKQLAECGEAAFLLSVS
jgi:hypothetical protein